MITYSIWNDSYQKLHFHLGANTDAFDIEAGSGLSYGTHKRVQTEVLDGKVGRANRRQSSSRAFSVREFPVQLESRTGANVEPGVGHELFGSAGKANTDDRCGILTFYLARFSQSGKQGIGLHLFLVPPEAQANFAARSHDASCFTQGFETVAPDAATARHYIKTIVLKWQVEHIPNANICLWGPCLGNRHEAF
jgi:hypothetical protein